MVGPCSDKIWYEDLGVLVRRYAEFFPSRDETFAERCNAITRLFIYLAVAMYIYNRSVKYAVFFVVAALLLALVYAGRGPDPTRTTASNVEAFDGRAACTRPTANNPTMNFLYGDSPNRPAACPYDQVKNDIDPKLNAGMFRDVGDLNDSNRQFYTMPSTTIVNDRQAFADFVFGGSLRPTCKESTAAQP